MNSHILKIVGQSELTEPLEFDHDYLISINATITGISKKSDDQGGIIFTYKANQRTCEVLKSNGQVLKGKDKSKQSQKLRIAILGYQQSDNPEIDDELYYNEIMGSIRHF